VIGWAFETMLATSALFLLVLLLRGVVARTCGAAWAYALWLLPLLRVAMPPLVWLGAEPELPPILVRVTGSGATATALPTIDGPGQWMPVLLVTWAAGAALFAAWQWLGYRRFLARIAASTRPSYPSAFEGINLIESRAVDGPVAIGFTNPRIVLPYDFLGRYTAPEQELALRHEWHHHQRGDLWWNLAALGLLAVHWFNPLAWIAFRAFRADQELACDAAVIASASAPTRHAYALALVKTAAQPQLVSGAHIGPKRISVLAGSLGNAHQLKRRLKMMTSHRNSRWRNALGGLIVAGTFGTGLCLSAPTLAQTADSQPKEERRIIIREIAGGGGKRVEFPADVRERLASCPEAQRLENDVQSEGGPQQFRTRVIVCSSDGKTPGPQEREKLAAALDRAHGEISELKDISPERRSEILEALRREMAQVRSGGK
jgi:beta-lactamase regulating signal transducer with metallopeptidase domain